ncbi:MAG: sulfatase-like hydrolase/transferase [Candidatus Omnitrophica bacterium]|nr:sulfatase-like hydrolase/transferase [Candidatus Omnitrophota bacterium]
MSAKKSLVVTLRIFFILFSLMFIRDAFYKWDGYSYYMGFKDFLPDLSLSFILWTLLGVIAAFLFWIVTYGLSKVSLRYLKINCFEQVLIYFLLGIIAFILKKTFLDISISDSIGINYYLFLISSGLLVLVLFWLASKYINFEKALVGIDIRIAPLFWIFTVLLILAVPFSMIKKSTSDSKAGYHSQPSTKTAQGVFIGNNKRPNIIVVVMDALTALDMQLYGYHRPTTPFIAEWAKDAIVFNRAYSTSNWTTPSTMSILTGQRPWTHRVWYLAENHPVSFYKNNLPDILREHGYAVYGFAQNNYAHPKTLGMKDAFIIRDEVDTFWISPTWLIDKSVEFYLKRPIVAKWIFIDNPLVSPFNIKLFRFPYYITSIRPETVYNRFLDVIAGKTEQPFFAYIHVYPPHFPYNPRATYMGAFGDAEELNTPEKQINSSLIGTYYKPDTQRKVNILRKRYDEFILDADNEFKIFMERLSEKTDMSNTVIIFTSDHGESFSNGYVSHGEFELYESLVRVPLVIKTPRTTKTLTAEMPVEQIDIAPTILELADIPVPEWMEGRSLVPVLEGKTHEPRPVFSMQLMKNRILGNYFIDKGTIAVWDGGYKLVNYLEKNKSLLFDLKSDTNETRDISKEEPQIAQRLAALIENELSRANKSIKRSNAY